MSCTVKPIHSHSSREVFLWISLQRPTSQFQEIPEQKIRCCKLWALGQNWEINLKNLKITRWLLGFCGHVTEPRSGHSSCGCNLLKCPVFPPVTPEPVFQKHSHIPYLHTAPPLKLHSPSASWRVTLGGQGKQGETSPNLVWKRKNLFWRGEWNSGFQESDLSAGSRWWLRKRPCVNLIGTSRQIMSSAKHLNVSNICLFNIIEGQSSLCLASMWSSKKPLCRGPSPSPLPPFQHPTNKLWGNIGQCRCIKLSDDSLIT